MSANGWSTRQGWGDGGRRVRTPISQRFRRPRLDGYINISDGSPVRSGLVLTSPSDRHHPSDSPDVRSTFRDHTLSKPIDRAVVERNPARSLDGTTTGLVVPQIQSDTLPQGPLSLVRLGQTSRERGPGRRRPSRDGGVMENPEGLDDSGRTNIKTTGKCQGSPRVSGITKRGEVSQVRPIPDQRREPLRRHVTSSRPTPNLTEGDLGVNTTVRCPGPSRRGHEVVGQVWDETTGHKQVHHYGDPNQVGRTDDGIEETPKWDKRDGPKPSKGRISTTPVNDLWVSRLLGRNDKRKRSE